jgi:alpha-1,6-mannosyl-glycoprotein beta-1,2-N-acetylglucosaminyltransferase
MFNKVFRLEETKEADGFLFLEEDYLVAPTIYETIQNGFQYIDEPGKNRENQYFGLTFDATEGYAFRVPHLAKQGWIEKKFVTGPMAIRREMYERIRKNAKHYCTWDDYNWDWSFVHLMSKSINVLPFRVLVPGVQQVAHIGIEGGLHEENNEKKAELMQRHKDLTSFHRKVGGLWTKYQNKRSIQDKGFGGWGHPRDQEHCLDLFRPSEEGKKTAW